VQHQQCNYLIEAEEDWKEKVRTGHWQHILRARAFSANASKIETPLRIYLQSLERGRTYMVRIQQTHRMASVVAWNQEESFQPLKNENKNIGKENITKIYSITAIVTDTKKKDV
jgi:hypothetical protein